MTVKRTIDVIAGVLLCVLVTPVILLLAVVLAITLRTWRPFFVQTRIGHGRRDIRIVKLRTLPVTTPRYALKGEICDVPLHPLARWLRRAHLDELPQLFLVPLGRLSLVGPRPKMPDTYEPADEAYVTARTAVRQGCTGLWQIGPDHARLPHETPVYDTVYVERSTLRLDFWILWRTALLMTHLGGPVKVSDIPPWLLRQPTATAADASGSPDIITTSAA